MMPEFLKSAFMGFGFSQAPHFIYGILILVLIPLTFVTFRLRQNFFKNWTRVPKSSESSLKKPPLRSLKTVLFFSGILLCWLSLLGPSWGQKENVVNSEGMDLCFALDLSQSMLAEDVLPNRLKMAKNQLSIFLQRLGGDRVAVVGFAGSSFVASPLSPDKISVASFIEPIDTSFVSHPTTRLEAGIDGCLSALKTDESLQDESFDSEATRVIVMISDGEDSQKDSPALDRAIKLSIPIFTLGIGTAAGAPIPKRNEWGEITSMLKNPTTSKLVHTKLSPLGLQHISSKSGGLYLDLNSGLSAWDTLETELDKFSRKAQYSQTQKSREEKFQWPLALAFILLLLDFIIPEMGFRQFRFTRKLSAWIGVIIFSNAAPIHAIEYWPTVVFLNRKAYQAYLEDETRTAHQHLKEAFRERPSALITLANKLSLDLLGAYKIQDSEIRKTEMNKVLLLCEKILSTHAPWRLRDETPAFDQRVLKIVSFQCGAAAEASQRIPDALKYHYQNTLTQGVFKDAEEKSQRAIIRLLSMMNQKKNQNSGDGDSKEKNNSENPSSQKDGQNQKFEKGQGQQPRFNSQEITEQEAKKILESVAGEEQAVKKRKAQDEARREAQKSSSGRPQNLNESGNPW